MYCLLCSRQKPAHHSPGPRHFCLTGVPYLDSTLWLGPSTPARSHYPAPSCFGPPLAQPYPYKVTKPSGHSSSEPLLTHSCLGPAQSSKPSPDTFGLTQPTSPPRHSHQTLAPFPPFGSAFAPPHAHPYQVLSPHLLMLASPLAPPHTSTSCSHQGP